MAAVGLLFLDDLRSFAPWISDRAPTWASAHGLDGQLLAPTLQPPPVLVVVARSLTWSQLELSAAWMADAEVIIVVVDPTGDIEPDANTRELQALERELLRTLLGGKLEFIDVGAAGLDAAIEEALALALALDRPEAHTRPWRRFRPFEPEPQPSPPGSWFAWHSPLWRDREVELVDVVRQLGPALCRYRGRPMFLDGIAGERVDLRDGSRQPVDDLAGAADFCGPLAAFPDGRAWLQRCSSALDRGPAWAEVRADPREPARVCSGGWGQVIGVDPSAQVAWTGGRCHFDWRVLGPRGPALWTPSSHDWPCGHGKKLYGFADNDPLLVQLAGDAQACLSIYEHDTLLTPGLPIRWRDLGRFALAERSRGEPRALLFVRADGDEGFPGSPYDADEEDARDRYAVASLGPSPRARYVVGLGDPTYRLVDGVVTRLGAGREWIVCDEQHRVVRREPGRMLAGWGPWVVFEHQHRLWREDLSENVRASLGPVDRDIAGAVAVPGTPNVVLIALTPEVALALV